MSEPRHHFFGENPLNRLSFLRDQAAFLNAAATHTRAKWILFTSGGRPMVKTSHTQRTTHLALFSTPAISHILGSPPYFGQGKADGEYFEVPEGEKNYALQSQRLRGPLITFLGVLEDSPDDPLPSRQNFQIPGQPYFALDVQAVGDELITSFIEEQRGEDAELEFVEPMATMGDFESAEAGIFAQGRSLWDWNSQRKFCPACASPVYSLWGGWKLGCSSFLPWAENGDKPPCPSGKGLHNYTHPRTDIVVITAVTNEEGDMILLGRNKRFVFPMYSALAGFIEPGESLEDAVKREIWEESGVKVHNVRYHSGQPWPFPANMMVGCYATADPSQPIRVDLDPELIDARWFTREEVLRVMQHPKGMLIRKREYKQINDHIEGNANEGAGRLEGNTTVPLAEEADRPAFRLPPLTSIAGVLISNWAHEKAGTSKL